ncbi:MAG: hypothetical protein JNM39_18630 [Bdellovibrionaceae bacterium]|nr:hypothetical protein [Pseudobdellovibrionaceae bacterium]
MKKQIDPVVAQYLQQKEVTATEKPIDPMVAEYLKQKMQPQDQFSPEAYQKVVAQSQSEQDGIAFSQFASGIGNALAGRDNSSSDNYYKDLRGKIQDRNVGEFNRQKQSSMEANEAQKANEVNDPNSSKSVAFRKQVEAMMPSIAKAYGPKWQTVTAADGPNILNLQKMQDSRNEAKMRFQGQKQDRQLVASEKQSERDYALKTPYGPANSIDDAKQLKTAHESKQNFDSKLNELIALRQEYGGELLNREAVGRGKQLSKDLLLEYKNMAKLGVLSQSDERIINAIIPDDPLGFSMAPGQDPIMHQLKKFKEDSDKDFSTRVSTRTRNNVQINPAQNNPSKPKWAR